MLVVPQRALGLTPLSGLTLDDASRAALVRMLLGTKHLAELELVGMRSRWLIPSLWVSFFSLCRSHRSCHDSISSSKSRAFNRIIRFIRKNIRISSTVSRRRSLFYVEYSGLWQKKPRVDCSSFSWLIMEFFLKAIWIELLLSFAVLWLIDFQALTSVWAMLLSWAQLCEACRDLWIWGLFVSANEGLVILSLNFCVLHQTFDHRSPDALVAAVTAGSKTGFTVMKIPFLLLFE
jgi:hypothetical protein